MTDSDDNIIPFPQFELSRDLALHVDTGIWRLMPPSLQLLPPLTRKERYREATRRLLAGLGYAGRDALSALSNFWQDVR